MSIAKQKNTDPCKNIDMLESAKVVAENAIQSHMQIHGVDRDTARYWVSHAVLWNHPNAQLNHKQ